METKLERSETGSGTLPVHELVRTTDTLALSAGTALASPEPFAMAACGSGTAPTTPRCSRPDKADARIRHRIAPTSEYRHPLTCRSTSSARHEMPPRQGRHFDAYGRPQPATHERTPSPRRLFEADEMRLRPARGRAWRPHQRGLSRERPTRSSDSAHRASF